MMFFPIKSDTFFEQCRAAAGSAAFSVFCCVMLLCFKLGFGETQGSRWETLYKTADSLLDQILARQETRRKEIAPADSLFRDILAKHPDVYFLIRTNSKGIIVNTISRGSVEVSPGKDVSNDKWYSVPQKTMKPFHSPAMQVRGKNKNSLLCSKPIVVKNSLGTDRFGGALAMHICFFDAETSQPKKEKKVAQANRPVLPDDTTKPRNAPQLSTTEDSTKSSNPTNADGLIRQSSLSADTARAPQCGSAASQTPSAIDTAPKMPDSRIDRNANTAIDKSSIPKGADTASARKAPPGMLVIFIISCMTALIAGFAFVVSLRGKRRARRPGSNSTAPSDSKVSQLSDRSIQSRERSLAMEIGRAMTRLQAEEIPSAINEEPPLHSLNVAVAQDETITMEGMRGMHAGGAITVGAKFHDLSEQVPAPDAVPSNETADFQSVNSETPALGLDEEKERLKEGIRSELAAEMKKEIMETEMVALRNAVIAELKADIRQKLERNEAESIRAHIQDELSGIWRREIEENFHDAFYKQELESLRKIVREKLVEKEMPLLVKSHRVELSKEIRQKMTASFYDQIERHERNVMKAEIIKKLQTNDYPQLFQEEREKLRASLERQVAEKESETLSALFREELSNRLRTQVLTEEESIRGKLRDEIAHRIEREVMDGEYDAMVAESREILKERARREIEAKELQPIHDRLVARITEEEKTRIMSEELAQIIESERNRIAEREAPALREQVREQLTKQEFEAMHARVKNEIYSETVQTIREACDREYRELFEKKTAEYREATERKLHSEMKKNLVTEYHSLTEDLERLSGSISDVEALDSLSKTISLLSDEKKKYKYFNLNSAQTESLLEYLKRVQSRFNIFLDKIDQALREMELKVNSVMNKLDGE